MRAVIRAQLSQGTIPKILCGIMAGDQNPTSASLAPDIGEFKDDTYGERWVSRGERQNPGALVAVLGCQKIGNRRRPTSPQDPRMHMSA